jgi:hypothetical protein
MVEGRRVTKGATEVAKGVAVVALTLQIFAKGGHNARMDTRSVYCIRLRLISLG